MDVPVGQRIAIIRDVGGQSGGFWGILPDPAPGDLIAEGVQQVGNVSVSYTQLDVYKRQP